MPRTTNELVRGIIEVEEGVDLTPFITVASSLVTELLEGKHDEERLVLIETWLAAHFYTVKDPRSVSEGAGPVTQSVQSKIDLFLSTSHYGQHAVILDTTGTLAGIGRRKIEANLTWLGLPIDA
jgi:hypothetical protein